MAELHFNNDHNKVAYLLKPTESLGFHQIIDFMNGLYIVYALTANPTIYASVVRQVWGSASEVSLPDGVRGLVATIDGTAYTVTKASIRSALQLDDLNAIDTMTNAEIFAGLQNIGYTTEEKFTFFKNKFSPQWKFFIHTLIHCLSPKSGSWNQFASNIAIALICLSTGRKYKFSNMIFNVASHPSPDPMPSSPRQSSPPLCLLVLHLPLEDDDTGGAYFHESPPHPHPATPTFSPTIGVAEEPLTLTSLLALFPTCLQRIANLEAELKATKILHRDTVVLFAKRIKKLESKLKSKQRKLVLSDSENEEEERQSKELDALLDLANVSLHEPSLSTTSSKPANPEHPTTLDAVLTLSQSKARARAATIIYKRLKKQQSSSGLNFTDADIPAGGLDSAGGLDFAETLLKTKQLLLFLHLSQLQLLRNWLINRLPFLKLKDKNYLSRNSNKALMLNKSTLIVVGPKGESMASAAQSTHRQAELDRVALNLTNEEWIGLVDQVRANPTLFDELLGADVSEDTFSVRMVELMNRRRKAIIEMKAKAKREKPMTPAQQKEFMRTFIRRAVDLATAKAQHQQLKRSGETLESSESNKLKSSHSTTQPAEMQETTYVSAGATIAAGDLIPAVTSVYVASSISAGVPIAADVSISAGAFGTASQASVPIIELLDSPPKDTSLPLDPEIEEQDVPLRKSSRKKSIARKRTLPSPSKPKSDALSFDEDDPEAEFKRYLRQASDDDEPAEPVSLALVSDITTWEIIPTEFGRGKIHVITSADGTVKRFSTLRELMYWAGRADLMVLYGLVSAKYKTERATAGDIMYMFVNKKYPLTPETIQQMLNHGLEIDRDPSDLLKVCRALTMPAWVHNCPAFKLEEIVMAMMTCLKSSGVYYQCFTVKCGLLMFTRSIVIQRRVEDLQLSVESYQKKLNLTRPDTYRSDLKRKEAYIAYSNPIGFIYQNKHKQNRLMRIDELHKFSDGTLIDVRTALDDRLKGIRMKYLPRSI
uniref:Synaptobrevin, longin-like domain protein n=1 Tax=Tanacetum cinerariifolium TaxID=118510 RepID=A0A6L2NGV3_TANCI|nr:synaptobrevin, longin-like domain protein [Tanacetum cinerariifolium]